MMGYWGWGFPNKPIRKNGKMSDDLTTAYLLGVEHMRDKLHKQADEIECLRAENEKLRRDVKTAVMGDSAELADVKRENEKLKDVLKNCIAALRHAYFHGFTELYKTTADEAAAALWESVDD